MPEPLTCPHCSHELTPSQVKSLNGKLCRQKRGKKAMGAKVAPGDPMGIQLADVPMVEFAPRIEGRKVIVYRTDSDGIAPVPTPPAFTPAPIPEKWVEIPVEPARTLVPIEEL